MPTPQFVKPGIPLYTPGEEESDIEYLLRTGQLAGSLAKFSTSVQNEGNHPALSSPAETQVLSGHVRTPRSTSPAVNAGMERIREASGVTVVIEFDSWETISTSVLLQK